MSYLLEGITRAITDLPGMGRKSAQRIAFYFLKKKPDEFREFIQLLEDFYEKTETCEICGAVKAVEEPCEFCNARGEATEICVVEHPSDIFSIEASGEYQGLYHVLMGVLSPLDGVLPENLRLTELAQRLKENKNIVEIIVATNPSVEGNATANYIRDMLEDLPVRVSRIAAGLPLGSHIEYADSQVLAHSIRKRQDL